MEQFQIIKWSAPFPLIALNPDGSVKRPLVRLPSYVRNVPGVYLWTIKVGDVYLLHDIGQTKLLRKWVQHDRGCLLNGHYWLQDPERLRTGQLAPIYNPNKAEDRVRLLNDSSLQRELAEYASLIEIVVGEVPDEHRLRLRIETELSGWVRSKKACAHHILWGDWKGADLRQPGEDSVKVRFVLPPDISVAGMPLYLTV